MTSQSHFETADFISMAHLRANVPASDDAVASLQVADKLRADIRPENGKNKPTEAGFRLTGFLLYLEAGLTHSIVTFRQSEVTGHQPTGYIPNTFRGQGGTR